MYARAGQFFSAVFLFSIWFPFVYLHCSVWNLLVLFWAMYCFLSIQKLYVPCLGFCFGPFGIVFRKFPVFELQNVKMSQEKHLVKMKWEVN